MTSPDSTSVRDLSSGQVRSLLAVGLSGQQSGPTSPDGLSAEDILDADPQILAQVIEDLKTPCPDEGPFSIFRVCGADSSQSACFENQSWLQLLAAVAGFTRHRSRDASMPGRDRSSFGPA